MIPDRNFMIAHGQNGYNPGVQLPMVPYNGAVSTFATTATWTTASGPVFTQPCHVVPTNQAWAFQR